MYWLMAALMITLLGIPRFGEAELVTPPQTVRGDLLTIEGDNYVIHDVLGRFIRVRVNQNTQAPLEVKPGEQIEARVLPDGRALSIRPTSQHDDVFVPS